ncbi:MAG: tRNA guanosine(34) transglycosylase Tgt [Bacteroidales bacterium]|jgi:queuine tRNA-ribosyltransferase|nr:tRNA guanosine(34) transglycosylase Tgt [Bacteroidales bacterium]
MKFRITHKDNSTFARTGIISTGHGEIETPVFMPVGTAGTVKGVHIPELRKDINAQIILGNTYHLYLRPGIDIIHKAGGLHKFNGWDGPILTDSGGFQVFSLAENRKLTEDGAMFRSHIDGSKHIFTPENVVEIQRNIGADIIMAFDECTPYPCDYKYASKSLDLTQKWLLRGWKKFNQTEPLYNYPQTFFPIVQGSVYKDLRKDAARFISDLGADGNAIGGLSVGEPAEQMYEMIDVVNEVLPQDKPRYLMGVGTPVNLLEGIERGIDMFDCVMPTRNARNGMLFTSKGTINMKNKKWEDDFSPVDEAGTTFVDKFYTKAYLRHLIISGEILGAQIASIHNLGFYTELMRQAREHIKAGTFPGWKKEMVEKLNQRL